MVRLALARRGAAVLAALQLTARSAGCVSRQVNEYLPSTVAPADGEGFYRGLTSDQPGPLSDELKAGEAKRWRDLGILCGAEPVSDRAPARPLARCFLSRRLRSTCPKSRMGSTTCCTPNLARGRASSASLRTACSALMGCQSRMPPPRWRFLALLQYCSCSGDRSMPKG